MTNFATFSLIFEKIRYEISWETSASRRFSWNIIPYLLFLKKQQIWNCRLLQILGGTLCLFNVSLQLAHCLLMSCGDNLCKQFLSKLFAWERIFWKSWFWKNQQTTKKTWKNFPGGKELTLMYSEWSKQSFLTILSVIGFYSSENISLCVFLVFPVVMAKVFVQCTPTPVFLWYLTLYLIEISFNPFANRANPDQAALTRSGSTLFAYGNRIYLILYQWTWQVIYFSMYYFRYVGAVASGI